MSAPMTVRFAPSPTGPPHLGNLRTALVDWLVARAQGGRFIVRVEDTDQERLDPTAEAAMLDALRWLGLDWDEGPDIGGPRGPYRQSERLDTYRLIAGQLIEQGHAYRCDCSPERLEIVQQRLRAQGRSQVYDNHCRDLNIGPTDTPHVVRLKMPAEGGVAFHDVVHGEIAFEYGKLAGDIVLMKSDGFPTYHLAVVADDHAMEVTHVIRGDEWIPSTPIHIRLFEALGWEIPTFVHLPLVTDKQGKKIKKREPSFQASVYREAGYLPDAVANALALLGWNPGTTDEVFTLEELVSRFTLDRISKSPAIFDEDRLRWFARQHMARLSLDQLAERAIPLINAAYPQAAERGRDWLTQLIGAVREELVALNDVVGAVRFAFDDGDLTEEARAALHSESSPTVLAALRDRLVATTLLDAEMASSLFKTLRADFKQSHGWNAQAVMFPLRAALTGMTTGPHLSDVATLLGKDESLRRVEKALSLL